MARYLVIRVDNDDSAEKLIEKLEPVRSVEVIGLFFAGAKFCECPQDARPKARQHAKYHVWYCTDCKRVRQSYMQHPTNLLVDPEIHQRHHDLFISVWEVPHTGDPRDKYGEREVEAKRMTPHKVAAMRRRIIRARRSRARKVERNEDGG